MVEVQTVYFILGAVGIFIAGAFWGKALMWRVLLTAGYALWRMRGGMRRLLDCHDAPNVRELLGINELLSWTEAMEATYWAHMPLVMPEEGELGDGEAFVGDTLRIGDFWNCEAFCKALSVAKNDTSVFLVKVTFFRVFAYLGDGAEAMCHRRMSLPFFAYGTMAAGLPGCPVCNASFAQLPLRAARRVEQRERRCIDDVLTGIEEGGIAEFKCFAIQHPNVPESAVCLMNGREAQLQVFFGDESALQLWSGHAKKQLRPLTLEVVAPKKP